MPTFADLPTDIVDDIVKTIQTHHRADIARSLALCNTSRAVLQTTRRSDPAYPAAEHSYISATATHARITRHQLLDPLRLTCRALRNSTNANCYSAAVVSYGIMAVRVRFDIPHYLANIHTMHPALAEHSRQYAAIQPTQTITPHHISLVLTILNSLPAGSTSIRLCRTTRDLFAGTTTPIPAIRALAMMYPEYSSGAVSASRHATEIVVRDTRLIHAGSQFPDATSLDVSYSSTITHIHDMPYLQCLIAVNCEYLCNIRNIATAPYRPTMPPTVCDLTQCVSLVDVRALHNVKIIRLDYCPGITDVSALVSATVLSLVMCENVTHTGKLRTSALDISDCGRINTAELSEVGTLARFNVAVDPAQLPNVTILEINKRYTFSQLCEHANMPASIAGLF